MPEILVPYAYRELMQIQDCVARFGTKNQYIEYINAANSVRDNAGLLKLLDMAQQAIGDSEYELIEEIRKEITPNSSSPVPSDVK